MTDLDHLDRINALTANARQTWFALLAALVFVGITLMGVEHIDFYGVDRATELPLVSVEVPTPYFFYAAPVLLAAIYGYFHLYLIRLWDALGAAPARLNGIRLGNAISPWLVSDAALNYRARKRGDNSATPRVLEAPATLLNLMLAWGFGLIVLAFLWWQSLPARSILMSAIAMASLAISFFAGLGSLAAMRNRLRNADQSTPVRVFGRWFHYPLAALGLAMAASATYNLTEGSTGTLAPLDLTGKNIVERPPGWLPYDIARSEFLADWCARTGAPCVFFNMNEGERDAFEAEWKDRRSILLADLRQPAWSTRGIDPTGMDFRAAKLIDSFLAGANLGDAQMQGATLWAAQLEGARLDGAQLQNADLSAAQMQGVSLGGAAQLQGAYLGSARLNGAFLVGAGLQGAVLDRAELNGAFLNGAQMQGARLRKAQLPGAVLIDAQLQGADFREAHLREADLSGANLDQADLSDTQMQGADLYDSLMRGAKLTQAQMESADLRFAQMQEADLFEAKLQRANLRETNLRGAILVGANMHEADLSGAQLQKANLRAARLNGATLDFTVITGDPAAENVRLSPELRMSRNIPGLASIDLSMATNNGGMLRFVDMTEAVFDEATDFRNVFLDGSVSMTPEFRARMGNPCQWVDRIIEDDAEFYGRWRGWIEAARDDLYAPDWKSLAPSGFEDVEAVRPSPFCKWKTGPMPR